MQAVASDPQWLSVFGGGTAPAVVAQPGSGSGGSAERRMIDGPIANEIEEKVNLALKLGVINASYSRLLMVCTTRRFEIPTDGILFQALTASKTTYTSKTKGKKGHGMGPPDGYNAFALLVVLKEAGDKKADISGFLNDHAPGTAQMCHAVQVCRTEKMHDSNKKRLIVCATTEILEWCSELIPKAQGSEFFGPAPPGFLEAEAQRLLA